MQNLHPLFVPFPIAFLAAAAVCELLHLWRRRPLLDLLARWLLYLGAVSAALAVVSGWLGAQSVAGVAAARDSIARHERLGYLVLGTAALLAFWRAGTAPRGGPRPRWLFALGMAGLVALLWQAGSRGGDLVFRHGVGTSLTAPGGPLAEEDEADTTRRAPTGSEFR